MNLACTITVIGAVLSFIGVALHWPELLLIGLAFDFLDGKVARRMGEVTDFGSRLDWYTDTAMSHALLASLGYGVWSPILVVWQCWSRGENIRFSGRAALSLVAVVAYLNGAW